MVALEIILFFIAIFFGLICAKLPYKHTITKDQRMNFGALPP
jgi:hypothetical protein